ncbi:MAG: anthranilate synthase component I [Pseudomonadota bacterium]
MSAPIQHLIALTRELPGDLDTPVSAYLKLANQPFTYLLESMQGGEQWGRYSFIGLACREVIRVSNRRVSVTRDGVRMRDQHMEDPLAFIREHTKTVAAPLPGALRFTGGWVGYFGFETVRYVEPRLDHDQADPIGTPDILLMRSDEVVVFDAIKATITLVVHVEDSTEERERGERRLTELQAQMAGHMRRSRAAFVEPAQDLPFVSSMGETAFKAAVQKIKDYTAAGDVMQVVPAHRLTAPFEADPVQLYRAIRRLNPSPYLYCFNLGDHHVVGSSPEILVRVQDGLATVRPLAGTRKRGVTAEDDVRIQAELLADPKEVAEHLMLIDLGRNDVGRVAVTGSVKLTEKMAVEKYSHVMHIVSNVTAQLKPGLDALDALAATFPAGTLSGAPKVRAMEIIQELEPHKRGIYGGAVGYIGWCGNMDVAIAIRTAVIKDGLIHVQAGAGVVADSDPQAEWDETISKARAMMRAAAQAAGGSQS